MPADEKHNARGDPSPLLLAAGAGALGAWLWWRNRHPSPIRSNAMAGRVCVITGGNAGIGKATATALARQGAHIVIACRSPCKGDATVEDIRRKVPGAAVETLPLDLESPDSIRGFVELFRETRLPLHVLVNNAGLISGKPEIVRGMEKSMVVNHLGPFLLTNLLLPDLRRSGGPAAPDPDQDPRNVPKTVPASRIVNVSSKLEKQGNLLFASTTAADDAGRPPPSSEWFKPPAQAQKHEAFQLYSNSKLCNLLCTFELDRRLAASAAATREQPSSSSGRVTVNAVTPGVVNTGLGDSLVRPWTAWAFAPLKALAMRSADKGAETVVWAAASPEVEGVGGKLFSDMRETPSSETAGDEELARKLWKASEVAVGLRVEETEPTGGGGRGRVKMI